MIYVGIDVASKKHDCFIIDHNGVVPCDVFTITNDIEGFKKLSKVINDFKELVNDNYVRIGLESTGHYSKNILNYLFDQQFDVYLFNPLLTSMAKKASSVRKTKTDKTDAKAICKFLQGNWKDFQPYTRKLYHAEELKSLTRHRIRLTKEISQTKVQLSNLIDHAFPEYKTVFSNLYINCSLELLKTYSIPSVIKNTRIDALSNLLKKHSKGHHYLTTAKLIKQLAKESIGDDASYYAFEIRLIVEKIQFLNSQLDQYDNYIKEIMDKHFSIILSIPGVGYTTGAILIAGIGDISLFSSEDKLVAFIGAEPSIYQSGEFESSNSKMSKRGSKYMRYAIHHVSNRIIHLDEKFSKYYQKKINEGKHHFVALSHVGKKVIKTIYSILKYNTAYVTNH